MGGASVGGNEICLGHLTKETARTPAVEYEDGTECKLPRHYLGGPIGHG